MNFKATIDASNDPMRAMTACVSTKDDWLELSQWSGDGTVVVAMQRDQVIRLRTVINEWLDRE